MKIKDLFADRVDINFDISFWEYGIARNPENDMVIYSCSGVSEEKINDFGYDYTFVSKEEVIEAINEMEEGFFRCIDTSKKEYLKNVDNDNLSLYISDMNTYSGKFNDSCNYLMSIKDLIYLIRRR